MKKRTPREEKGRMGRNVAKKDGMKNGTGQEGGGKGEGGEKECK